MRPGGVHKLNDYHCANTFPIHINSAFAGEWIRICFTRIENQSSGTFTILEPISIYHTAMFSNMSHYNSISECECQAGKGRAFFHGLIKWPDEVGVSPVRY